MKIAEEVYIITEKFPKEERFGLTSQIRRSAISIPSNISEGAGRNNDNEFRHFLGILNGSSSELLTQLFLSSRLGLIEETETTPIIEQLIEVQKMNHSLIKKFTK